VSAEPDGFGQDTVDHADILDLPYPDGAFDGYIVVAATKPR